MSDETPTDAPAAPSFAEIAHKLYGATTPSSINAAVAPTTEAAVPSGEDGEPSEPASAEDIAAQMYGSTESLVQNYTLDLRDGLDRLTDAAGWDDLDRAEYVADVVHLFNDAKIQPREASSLHDLFVKHMQAPADDATVQAWTTDARRQLRERYGDDAPRRLEAAKAFVDARPDIKDILTRTGVGSHPSVVLALAERANLLRITPRKR